MIKTIKKIIKYFIRVSCIFWMLMCIILVVDIYYGYHNGGYTQTDAVVMEVSYHTAYYNKSSREERAQGRLSWVYNGNAYDEDDAVVDLPIDAEEGDVISIWVDSETGEFVSETGETADMFGGVVCILFLGFIFWLTIVDWNKVRKKEANK